MLGKGLESLIPPQNNNQNDDQNNQNINDAQNQNLDNFSLPNQNINPLSNNNLSPAQINLPNQNPLPDLIEEKDFHGENNLQIQPLETNLNEKENNLNQNQLEINQNNQIKEENKNTPANLNLLNDFQNKEDDLLKKPPQKNEFVFHIETNKIRPNPHQPRKDFSEENIDELAASIRQFGIIQPLIVTKIEKEIPTGTEVEYELIAGERRWLAAKRLGLETVPAIIRNIDTQKERLELAIIENIQRQNLNPIETARAFARLQDEFRLTQREIAARLGKSRETIANALRLLDLPAQIQDAIASGKISETHGRMLLVINDPKIQQKLFEDLLNYNLSTRELKRKINYLISPPKEKLFPYEHKNQINPEIKMLEEKLKLTFGTPVKIYQEGKNGKIIIEFYSDEEFKNIISKFNIGEN
jgi:ParB family chromosome partitioning protein